MGINAELSPADGTGTSWPLRAGLLLLTLSMLGCDHATKLAAETSLQHGPVSVVSGVLELRYAPNPDVAFSLMRTLGIPRPPGVLLAASALALFGVVAAWWATRQRATPMQHAGFALVLAGALGNVLDRAVRGYVVDFIHVTFWPVFNVADVAIVVGLLLLAASALHRRRAPPEARA